MKNAYLVGLVTATSIVGYLAGRHVLGLGPRALRLAWARVLECLGLAVLFFGGNLALGVLGILAARALTGGFVSLYVLDDAVLAMLSVLQALVFAWWRESRGNAGPGPR